MARKPRSGRGSSRTPVTIDLDAKRVDETKAAAAPAKSDAAVDIPKPEPVAMSSIDRGTSALGRSPTDDSTKPAAGAKADAASPKPDVKKADTAKSPDAKSPEPRASTAAQQPKSGSTNRKSGGLGAIGAGLIGGLVALVGGAGLQWTGALPSFGGSDQNAEAPTVDLTPLEGRIAELQAELERVSANAGNADTQAAASAANDQAAAVQDNVDNLQQQLEELRAAMASGSAGEAPALEAVSGRLDGVEQGIGAVQTQVDEITTQMSALSGTSGSSEDVAALGESVTGLKAGVEALQNDLGSFKTSVETSLADLQAKVEANAQTLADSDAGETVARAVAAAGLKTAIDRGSPFMAELETFASVGGSEETVATLRDFAASGVPTVTQLVEQFQPVARQIVATGEGVTEDASISDRLMSSARSLVQVRPVGEVEGDKPGAVVARIEERLKAGNLAAAVSEWESLPDAAKEATSGFADTMRARETVDGLVETLLNRAMAQTTDSEPPAASDAPAQSQ